MELVNAAGRFDLVFKFRHDDGTPFLVYHTAAIGDPPDHVPGKWYYRPYLGPIDRAGCGPFDSPEEAERVARVERDSPDESAP